MKRLVYNLCVIVIIFLCGCASLNDQSATLNYITIKQREQEYMLKKFQAEAVRLGFARWEVIDYNGTVEFRWNVWKNK